MIYAVSVNEEGLATSMLMFEGSSDEVPREGFFVFDQYEDAADKINKKWNGSTWETVPEPEPQPPEPTQEELLRQEVAELKEQLAAVKETTDATAMAVVDIGMAVMMP